MANETGLYWAGVDWGDEDHHVVVVDAAGRPRCWRAIEHSAEGLEELVSLLARFHPLGGVAVEEKSHLLIDKLLQAAIPVYPVNPKVAKTWREELKVDPPKDDARDAFSLADNIRLRHEHFRILRPDDPLTRELAMLCEMEQDEINERTAKAHRLKACLKRYHPEALGWFGKFTTTTAVDFVIAFPTPDALGQASEEELRKFLAVHCIGLSPLWKKRIARRQRVERWPRDPATIAAKSLRAVSLARQIKTQNLMLDQYRERIEALFREHAHAAIFASLPGAGEKLAPRLLSHFGADCTRYENAMALQALSGTVPLTKRSGKKCYHQFRWACQKDFRNTMFQFALGSIERSVWARAFYDRAKERGHSHAEALRSLGAKWLKIIYRMWCEGTIYDERIYLQSLADHNSPLIPYIRESEKCAKIMKKLLT
jgi:hypothetical protein